MPIPTYFIDAKSIIFAKTAFPSHQVPIPTYFIDAKSTIFAKTAFAGRALNPSLHYLGGCGIKEIEGLRVAYVSGVFPGFFPTGAKNFPIEQTRLPRLLDWEVFDSDSSQQEGGGGGSTLFPTGTTGATPVLGTKSRTVKVGAPSGETEPSLKTTQELHYTRALVEFMVKEKEKAGGAIDVLLTSEWPEGIEEGCEEDEQIGRRSFSCSRV